MSKIYSNHKGIKSALKATPAKGQVEIKDATTQGYTYVFIALD